MLQSGCVSGGLRRGRHRSRDHTLDWCAASCVIYWPAATKAAWNVPSISDKNKKASQISNNGAAALCNLIIIFKYFYLLSLFFIQWIFTYSWFFSLIAGFCSKGSTKICGPEFSQKVWLLFATVDVCLHTVVPPHTRLICWLITSRDGVKQLAAVRSGLKKQRCRRQGGWPATAKAV